MSRKEITLSPEELEELKDELRFRERVVLQLKHLNGIPKKVWSLEVSGKFQWGILILMIAGIVGTACKVIANGVK